MRQEKREFSRGEVRELFAEASAQKSGYDARKALFARSAQLAPVSDQRRVVAVGKTVLTFEVDEEFLRLYEQARDLYNHKGPLGASRPLRLTFGQTKFKGTRVKEPSITGLSSRGGSRDRCSDPRASSCCDRPTGSSERSGATTRIA